MANVTFYEDGSLPSSVMTEKEVANFLAEHGVRPSAQRVAIYHLLHSKRHHLTADEILQALPSHLVGVTRMTVYNSLNLFVNNGIVRTVADYETARRYDANTSPHAHFKCTDCGKIFDIPLSREPSLPEIPNGFSVKEAQLYMTGKCHSCG